MVKRIRGRSKSRGFTLVELIVVMAIIAILVLLALPRFMDYVDKARVTNIKNDIKIAEDLLTEYLIEYDTLPDDWGEVSTSELDTFKEEFKLYEKEGLVSEIQDGDYVTIDKQFLKDGMKTRLKGTFYTNLEAKVYYEDLKPGKVKSLEEKIEEGLDDIEDKIDKIEDKIDELPEDIDPEDTPEDTPEDIQDKIDEIMDDINDVEDDIDQIQDLIEELPENKRQDYQDRLDELKDRLEDLEDSFEFTESMIDVFVANGWIPVATADELQQINDGSEAPQTFGAGTKWENEYVGNLKSQFIQVQDIDLSSYNNWIPIGIHSGAPFEGDYNGGMYSIDNLNIVEQSAVSHGLFGTIQGDTKFKGIIITDANILLEDGTAIGALIGSAGYRYDEPVTIDISGIRVVNSNIEGENQVGGLIGVLVNSSTTIRLSTFSGEVVSNENTGGLVGLLNSGTKVEVDKVRVKGTIQGKRAGGLMGNNCSGLSYSIKNSSFDGSLEGEEVGGILGSNNSGATIILENIITKGSYEGESSVGGILGRSCSGECIFKNVSHFGNLYSEEGKVGGIIGMVTTANIDIDWTRTRGTFVGQEVGGVIGELHGDVNVTNIALEGNTKIIGESSAGGLIGEASSKINATDIEIGENIEIIGGEYAGGVVGRRYTNELYLSSSICRGEITADKVGGVGGYLSGAVSVLNSDIGFSLNGTTYTGLIAGVMPEEYVEEITVEGSEISGPFPYVGYVIPKD